MGCCNCNDYHEFPLDWLLEKLKIALEEWDSMKHSWEETKKYISDYFKNLDISEEINNKIDDMFQRGELDSLLNKFIPYVTPQMFGAKGDGESDDSEAFQNAINSAEKILVKKGNYLITKTLTIKKKTLLYGEGEASLITYSGTKFLFDIQCDQWNQPNIKDITFNGEENKFMRVGINKWGASVNIENCNIQDFNSGLFDLFSVSRILFTNLRIFSDGIINFLSYTGEYNPNTFSNNNTLLNVYITRKNKKGILFNLNNVKNLNIISSAFEKIETCFKCENSCENINMIGGWLENIDTIYTTDHLPVYLFNVNRALVANINNDIKFDYIINNTSKFIESKESGGVMLNKLQNSDNIILFNFSGINHNDTYSEYQDIVNFGSKETFLNTKLNVRRKALENTKTLTLKWKDLIYMSNVHAKFNVTVYSNNSDSSKAIHELKFYYIYSSVVKSDVKKIVSDSGQAESNNITINIGDTDISVVSDNNLSDLICYVKYEII